MVSWVLHSGRKQYQYASCEHNCSVPVVGWTVELQTTSIQQNTNTPCGEGLGSSAAWCVQLGGPCQIGVGILR